MHMMALGNLFYGFGFVMYGFVSSYTLFLIAMAVITIGEMIIAPVNQTLIANMAPENMRGRYMAAYQFGRGFASAVGPLAAGVILDYYDPSGFGTRGESSAPWLLAVISSWERMPGKNLEKYRAKPVLIKPK